MTDQDDEFLRSIPPFLRRTGELPPRKPAARPGAAAPTATPKVSPVTAAPSAPTPTAASDTPPQPARHQAKPAPRQHLELAVHNPAFDNLELNPGAEDIPVELSLPRSVVRQLRSLAADKDTTQRAIVLRALRLAGLSVPETRDPRTADLARADAR